MADALATAARLGSEPVAALGRPAAVVGAAGASTGEERSVGPSRREARARPSRARRACFPLMGSGRVSPPRGLAGVRIVVTAPCLVLKAASYPPSARQLDDDGIWWDERGRKGEERGGWRS